MKWGPTPWRGRYVHDPDQTPPRVHRQPVPACRLPNDPSLARARLGQEAPAVIPRYLRASRLPHRRPGGLFGHPHGDHPEHGVADPVSIGQCRRRPGTDLRSRWSVSLRPTGSSRLPPRRECRDYRPPYELYPAPGRPWDFTSADASLMARLGFNVVRLGVTWKGLEPGRAPANDPSICAAGPAHDPGQFNRQVMDRYLANLKKTVDLLGRFHIYTLIDMHQDVFNELFDGEGAPNWAVCTDGAPNTDPPGRWSQTTPRPRLASPTGTFGPTTWWEISKVRRPNLGCRRRLLSGRSMGDRIRPLQRAVLHFSDPQWGRTVRRTVGVLLHGSSRCGNARSRCSGDPMPGRRPGDRCDPADPDRRPRPSGLLRADIYGQRGYANFVGPMDFPNLVFNIHVNCGERSGKTGNPTNIAACAAQETHSFATRSEDRRDPRIGPNRVVLPGSSVSSARRRVPASSSS